MDKAKITIIAPRRPGEGFGGAEQHLSDLANVLGSLGADVRFISVSDCPPPGRLHRALTSLVPLFKSPLASRRLDDCALAGSDLVISIELMGVGIRHIRHLHLFFGSYAGFRGSALGPVSGLRRLHRRILDALARQLECRTVGPLGAIANSAGLRNTLLNHRIPVRTEVIPPPTDTLRFSPGDKHAARAALGLPRDDKLVLFAGRWEFAKGADRVSMLLSCLPPNWKVVLACPSVASWPWPSAGNVIRLLDVPNLKMHMVYQAADVLIQPSRFEGYSLVVSEAQASGCPVITTNVGHAPHLLSSTLNYVREGVISDPDNVAAWRDALLRIIGSEESQQDAAIQSRIFADQVVSYNAVRTRWGALLNELLPEFAWPRH